MVPHLFSPPERLEKPPSSSSSRESSPKSAGAAETTEGADPSEEVSPQEGTGVPSEAEEVADAAGSVFEGIVRIQGIEPSLDLPLEWVARNLCGPENFIHLIVISTRVAPQPPSS